MEPWWVSRREAGVGLVPVHKTKLLLKAKLNQLVKEGLKRKQRAATRRMPPESRLFDSGSKADFDAFGL